MAARIANAHEWLVLEYPDSDGGVVGFAYGHALNRLPTHRWSVETGIYLDAAQHRTGGGRALYTELLRRLTDRGYRRALAGMEARQLARRGVDAAGSGRRERRGRTARPDLLNAVPDGR
jgi:phosphinothricin acetyltransferase